MGVRQWHAWSLDHLRGRTANVSKNWCILPQRVYILGGQLLPSGFSKGIYSYVFLSFFKDFISFIFRERGRERERGEGREKERERNISVWLPLMCPPLGTWPTTQACALTGNGTGDPLVRRPVLSPLSHTSQGAYVAYIHSLK